MPAYALITIEVIRANHLSLQELILEWKSDVSVGQARDLARGETRPGLFQTVFLPMLEIKSPKL